MARTGRNMKLIIQSTHRDAVHRLFTDVLGATSKAPSPDFQFYLLADGLNIGVDLTPGQKHLADADWDLAPWLEFLVPDVDAANATLSEMQIRQVPYAHVDPDHLYWQVPGGPVFRLASDS